MNQNLPEADIFFLCPSIKLVLTWPFPVNDVTTIKLSQNRPFPIDDVIKLHH